MGDKYTMKYDTEKMMRADEGGENKALKAMMEKSTISIFKDSVWAILSELTVEECGLLFQKILKFGTYGEEEESESRLVEYAWKSIKPTMLRAATLYDDAKASGKLGGIIATLKSDRSLTQDNINFLHNNYTAEELKEKGFSDEMLEKAEY